MRTHSLWNWLVVPPLFGLALTGCGTEAPTGDPSPVPEPEPSPTVTITLNPESTRVFDTGEWTITASVEGANGIPVSWTSSDTNIARVAPIGSYVAQAVAVGPGTATIEAQIDTVVASSAVTVLERMGFVFPVDGVVNKDVFLVFYPGLISQDGTPVDYDCGLKTRGAGTEIVAPFFAALDSSITVVAAAAGTVVAASDDSPDPRTTTRGTGAGNFVRIAHRDGVETEYQFLKRGSVSVTVGETVGAGTPIGALGKSGEALLPSVHFLAYLDGHPLNPFAGGCTRTVDQWADQLPYQDTSVVLGAGLKNFQPTFDELVTDPSAVDTIRMSDSVATVWAYVTNIPAGTFRLLALIRPDSVTQSFTFYTEQVWRNIWIWPNSFSAANMTQLGTWRWVFAEGGVIRAEGRFELVP